MKRYWIILILAIVIGFGGIGIIIYNASLTQSWPITYLNTNNSNEANKITESTYNLNVIKYFPCNKRNKQGDLYPWANLYVCKSLNKQDSLSGDSLIVLLETKTGRAYTQDDLINSFWITIKPSKRFLGSKVLLPTHEMDSLKGYKFRYGEIKSILVECGNN